MFLEAVDYCSRGDCGRQTAPDASSGSSKRMDAYFLPWQGALSWDMCPTPGQLTHPRDATNSTQQGRHAARMRLLLTLLEPLIVVE